MCFVMESRPSVSMAAKKGAILAAKWYLDPNRSDEPFPLVRNVFFFGTARGCQGRAVVGRGEANP
jgi:hypothetical protein